MKIGIVLTNDFRSNAYLHKIIENKIEINEIFFMNDDKQKNISREAILISKKYGFDLSKSVKDVLIENKMDYEEFNFVNINHPQLIESIKQKNLEFVVFSGGGILREDILLLNTKFIHFHPGITPQYRGSTCFYYSIINEDSCGVTAFIMDEKLDTGDIIYQRRFSKPDHKFIDEVNDPYVRSETLVDIFKKKLLVPERFIKQDPNEGETYFIIHPVLKHISILSCLNDKNE